MKFRSNRSLQWYYSIVLLLTLISVSVGVKFFWDYGPVNTQNIADAYESSLLLENQKKHKDILQIKILTESDKAREAFKKISLLEKNIINLDKLISIDEFSPLKHEVKQTKSVIGQLLNYPELSSVMSVLGSKINSFEKFAIKSKWKTLTRMSRRVKARLAGTRTKTPGFLNYKNMHSLRKMLERDISKMSSVTQNSILSDYNKELILTKLSTLKTEMKMLSSYNKSLRKFASVHLQLNKKYKKWLELISPEVTLKKIQMERNSKIFILALLGLIAFLFIALAFGNVVYRGNRKRIQKEVEYYAQKLIQDGLIPLENKFTLKTSTDFSREVERFREYFHKRISFGSVFQEAVPFSCILLDSNLNLVWGNNLFYEHWHLNQKKPDQTISWDFLQRFTNLGENDPVIMAHNQGLAGIYQIQVRINEKGETLPYEMYVTPVEYASQKRIMIFFYPLRSLEETIAEQTRSIVGPVGRSLDTLATNAFQGKLKEDLKKDFDIAGIGELYEKFLNYHDFVQQQKNGLLNEIENLEDNYYDQVKLVQDGTKILKKKSETIDDAYGALNGTKNALIHDIDIRYEVEDQFSKSLRVTQGLLKEETTLLNQSEKASNIIEENIAAFHSVSQSRDQFKDLKGHIEELRGRLGQSLDQTMIYLKHGQDYSRMDEALEKIKFEVRSLDQLMAGFGQAVRQLDISLSKVGMIIEGSEAPDFSGFKEKLLYVRSEIEDATFQLGRLQRSAEKADEDIINNLKGFFDKFKDIQLEQNEIEKLLAQGESDKIFEPEEDSFEVEGPMPQYPQGHGPEINV
jgi:hypothetical protein